MRAGEPAQPVPARPTGRPLEGAKAQGVDQRPEGAALRAPGRDGTKDDLMRHGREGRGATAPQGPVPKGRDHVRRAGHALRVVFEERTHKISFVLSRGLAARRMTSGFPWPGSGGRLAGDVRARAYRA